MFWPQHTQNCSVHLRWHKESISWFSNTVDFPGMLGFLRTLDATKAHFRTRTENVWKLMDSPCSPSGLGTGTQTPVPEDCLSGAHHKKLLDKLPWREYITQTLLRISHSVSSELIKEPIYYFVPGIHSSPGMEYWSLKDAWRECWLLCDGWHSCSVHNAREDTRVAKICHRLNRDLLKNWVRNVCFKFPILVQKGTDLSILVRVFQTESQFLVQKIPRLALLAENCRVWWRSWAQEALTDRSSGRAFGADSKGLC